MREHPIEGTTHSGRGVELDRRKQFLSQNHVFLSPELSCPMPSLRKLLIPAETRLKYFLRERPVSLYIIRDDRAALVTFGEAHITPLRL
jgi:hypothetical protein